MSRRFGVAVVGCGLIGMRRAQAAIEHERTQLLCVYDVDAGVAESSAARFGARATASWSQAVCDPEVDIVCVATPNVFLKPIAEAAFTAGKHVLIEKPMGRNVVEANDIATAAGRAGKVLKVGFNHRYHPAIAEAHRRCSAGAVGRIISIRARYGHGGRPGYENEWRGSPEAAGGGELTDQGVHVVDLINWFAGLPRDAFCYVQTAVWPLEPLEDNGFGLFRFATGAIASMHTSWTQWKNLFSFEIFGDMGSLTVEGLGKSYGVETLTVAKRTPTGGAPSIERLIYDGPDASWTDEWEDFVGAVETGRPYLGTTRDGIAAMTMIDALYRSARSGTQTSVSSESP